MKISVKFEPKDIWVGVYWDSHIVKIENKDVRWIKIYVCILPLFPIIFSFFKKMRRSEYVDKETG